MDGRRLHNMDEITFLASFPPIQTALKITGNGDGMRIQLDIPETEMGQAARLILLRECVLEVTIKQADDRRNQPSTNRQNTTPARTTAKKRK